MLARPARACSSRARKEAGLLSQELLTRSPALGRLDRDVAQGAEDPEAGVLRTECCCVGRSRVTGGRVGVPGLGRAGELANRLARSFRGGGGGAAFCWA